MPSVSPAQQRLFGMVLAAKRGQLKNPSAQVQKVSSGISQSAAQDFAQPSFKKKNRNLISQALMAGKSGY